MKRNMYGAMNTNYKSLILVISLLFALSASISAAPGDLDPTFGNGGKRTDWTGYASGVAIQPDGKIVVVGGSKGCCSPDTDFRVARYNPDGSPDTTFGGGTGRVTTDFNGNPDASESVVLQPDGKIIVAGWAVLQSSGAFLAVARYNPDGSLDTTFGGGSGKVLTPPDYFGFGHTDVAIQPDGKILAVLGQFDLNGNNYGLLVRYNADGSPDTSFGNGGSLFSDYAMFSVTVQPADGKIVVNENGYYTPFDPARIARFNTNGSLDTGFGSGGRVALPAGCWMNSLAIDSAGKFVTAGGCITGSTFKFALFRFNVDGSPDSSFDGDGIVTTPSLHLAHSIVIQSDGKIVAAGDGPGPGNYDLALARYNSNGSLDNTFGGGDGITTVDFNNSSDFGVAVALDSQGRAVVVGGTGPVGGGPYVFAIARFLGDSTATCPNPIDCPEFFVRQHYRDFLEREAEPSGLAAWLGVLNNCAIGDLACQHEKRLITSASFFGSQEFHLKGYFVFRFYRVAFARLPEYSEISADMRSVTGQTPDDVYSRKATFTNSFVRRPEFVTLFNGLTNADYVTALLSRYNLTTIITPDPSQPDGTTKVTLTQSQLVSHLEASTLTRAQVLRAIADSDEVLQAEFTRAFVAMQYYGYLRRTPESTGYNDWLNYLNSHPTDFLIMVHGFVDSIEYRSRFGPP